MGELTAQERYLVAFDIDGTLVDAAGHIHDSSVQMLKALAVNDACELVLATGRSLGATHELVQQLGLADVTVVCANGAVLGRLSPGGIHVLRTEVVDASMVVARVTEIDPDCAIAVEGADPEFLVNRPFPDGHLMGPWRAVGLDELVGTGAFRITIHSSLVAATISSTFSDMAVLARADIGQRGWFDVLKAGISKAHALEYRRFQLGIASNRTFACGDHINDIEMLRWASFSAAVDGAPAEVIEVSSAVVPPPSEGGAAEFVRMLHHSRRV